MNDARYIQSVLEKMLQSAEHELGISITIVDRHGVFHTREGEPLLAAWRSDHKRSPVCKIGYCNLCKQHCREEIVDRAAQEPRPFVHCCWKSVIELVVPMNWRGTHVGTLFAGAWRRGTDVDDEMPEDLPSPWYEEYDLLPLHDAAHLERLGDLLEAFGLGLLMKLESLLEDAQSPTAKHQKVRDFLRHNYARPVKLADLAELLGLSESRTSHLVRELFDTTFQQLLREERISAAKMLLSTTEFSASEIATLVGMPNIFHFGRTFKELVGTPPGKYRKNL